MVLTWTTESIGRIVKVVVEGEWHPEMRPPMLYREILDSFRKTKAPAMLLVNHAKGRISKEESKKIGMLGGGVTTLYAVAYIPGEFPDRERVQNFTVARVAGSAIHTPFETFYDEAEAVEWLQNAIKEIK